MEDIPGDPPVVLPPSQELFRLDEACRLTGLQPAALRQVAGEVPTLAPAPAANGQLFLTRRQVLLLAELRRRNTSGRSAAVDPTPTVPTAAHVDSPSRSTTPTAPGDPAPRAGRTPWEDTEVRNQVEARLEPILDGIRSPDSA